MLSRALHAGAVLTVGGASLVIACVVLGGAYVLGGARVLVVKAREWTV